MATSSSSSFQESNSTSSSTPTYLETPENEIMNSISAYAQQLAQQMQQWASGVFQNTSRITDQAVGNFFNTSNQMMGLSHNLTDQYNNIFSKQNASLAKEADEYNSVGRQRVNMGMAGATQRQAGDAALRSSEEALRSYGINPADGRYAALDKAAAVQNSANTAGAMNLERDRTAQVGRDLRRDAVQVGSMLPAAIANVNNTAIQANTGASNATLANANTGRNLNSLSNDYLKTAMEIKMPVSGQNTQAQSKGQGSGSSQSSSPSGGGGSQGGGRQGGGGGAPTSGGERSGPAWMPTHGSAQESSHGSRHAGGPPNALIMGTGGGGGYDPNQNSAYKLDGVNYGESNPYWGGYDTSDPLGGSSFEYGNGNIGGSGYSDTPINEYGGQGDQGGFDNYDFGKNGWDDTYGGGGNYDTHSGGSFGEGSSWGNVDYNTDANSVDTGWGQTYDTPVATDWGSGADQFTGGSSGGYDTQNSNSDFYDGGYSGNYDDYGGVYAEGGPVDPSRSPSGGQMVDDVQAQAPAGPARLNVNEFVIPQDVALWKGQEFFQQLIDKSRRARVTAPAPGAQPAGPPRQNQPMMG